MDLVNVFEGLRNRQEEEKCYYHYWTLKISSGVLVSRHILLLLSVLMCWSMYKEGHLQWEPKLWDKAPNADEIYRQFSVD